MVGMVAVEVEISVVGHVYDGGSIGGGGVGYVKLIIRGEGIGDGSSDVPGKLLSPSGECIVSTIVLSSGCSASYTWYCHPVGPP